MVHSIDGDGYSLFTADLFWFLGSSRRLFFIKTLCYLAFNLASFVS